MYEKYGFRKYGAALTRKHHYCSTPPAQQSDTVFTCQGNRKVDEAIIFLLTANSGGERLTMKSRLFVSATADS